MLKWDYDRTAIIISVLRLFAIGVVCACIFCIKSQIIVIFKTKMVFRCLWLTNRSTVAEVTMDHVERINLHQINNVFRNIWIIEFLCSVSFFSSIYCRFSFFVVYRKAVTILAHGFCWTPLPIQTAAQIAPPITSVPITSALVTLAIARRNTAIAMMSSNHSNHLPRYDTPSAVRFLLFFSSYFSFS